MDTFAFRNENPKIQIFELDHPDTQRYKLNRIHELEWNVPENVRYIPIDFEKHDMLKVMRKSGFDTAAPAFFAILGVTYYLTLPVFEQTIEKIGWLSGKESQVVFDFPDETTFAKDGAKRVRQLAEITAKLGEPMQYGYSIEEIQKALLRHGFLVCCHQSPQTIQQHYFENRIDKQRAFENIHFILAEKVERKICKS